MKNNKNIKITLLLIMIISALTLTSCQKEKVYHKHSDAFFDSFDTVTQVVAYTETEKEFREYMDFMHDRFLELHKYYDKYNSYEGINNIKTINDNAGIEPVKVDDEILELLLFSKEWYEKAGSETNIALGPVVEIWHDHKEEAELDPSNAKMPDMDKLKEASKYTDMNKVIIDEENKTVFLEEKGMSLDVGAVAKGYATEIVAQEVEEKGLTSCLISAGGNIRGIGKPLDGQREKWGVGIQNPDTNLFGDDKLIETVYINDMSVVSSGDYQRYYYVGDKRMHHIIDPNTLLPGENYRAVTVVTKHSGLADFLSTSLFLLPFDESLELVESIDGLDALWVFSDGTIKTSQGMKEIMYSEGARGGK